MCPAVNMTLASSLHSLFIPLPYILHYSPPSLPLCRILLTLQFGYQPTVPPSLPSVSLSSPLYTATPDISTICRLSYPLHSPPCLLLELQQFIHSQFALSSSPFICFLLFFTDRYLTRHASPCTPYNPPTLILSSSPAPSTTIHRLSFTLKTSLSAHFRWPFVTHIPGSMWR